MKKILYKNELLIVLLIICLSVIISIVTPSFFSIENLFDMLQRSVLNGILATAVLLVLISGGIDVSFASIAMLSAYSTIMILNKIDGLGSVEAVILAFLIAGVIGTVLGLVNGLLISVFKLPTLIVTLGTSNMFQGILMGFVGTLIINIPDGLVDFGKIRIMEVTTESGSVYGFSILIFVLIAVLALVWYMLRYTRIGRKIYAIGGNQQTAKRLGINVSWVQIFTYCLAGLISAIGGIVHVMSVRMAVPTDIIGTELNIIAAVVIGGARITGGYGTVLGTILGVFLVILISSCMILLHIPTSYQGIAVGALIILGTGISAYQAKKSQKINII